jgi:CNT family concentrative nucleoside transporter
MLAVYSGILSTQVPGAAGHLIVASVINVPAALMLAALMVPEVVKPPPASEPGSSAPSAEIVLDDPPRSSMDAVVKGTREGVNLLVAVTAMLVVAVALVSLTNMVLTAIGVPLGVALTLERILGWVFAPLAWLTGIPWSESAAAGSLLGIKTVLTEFVAYLNLAALPPEALSPRTRLIITYALCGFANLASLGIMIGGLCAMVPSRREDIVDLAPRTVVSGTLATLLTAAVVGLVTPA